MSANFPIIVSGGNRHQTGSHARTRKTAADQKLNLPVVLPADLKSDQSICIFDGITTATTIPTTDAMRSDLTEKLVNPFIIILKDFKNVKPDSLSSPRLHSSIGTMAMACVVCTSNGCSDGYGFLYFVIYSATKRFMALKLLIVDFLNKMYYSKLSFLRYFFDKKVYFFVKSMIVILLCVTYTIIKHKNFFAENNIWEIKADN